ncbi:MAG: hypothetical protein PHE17_17675 [Thiothrix sp.]|uniref:hypothetical protein n=1 Tax=Thiothrix sp. TaxID=1032 RepID=UPI002639C457|nr:hypothetical protein [Thiothrix sp.]MDD5394851.1 hypothetical protein [Thiothrix sp.]
MRYPNKSTWVLMAVLATALAACSVSPNPFLAGAGCRADGTSLPWKRPTFPAKPPAKRPPVPVFAFPAVLQRPAGYAERSAVYVFAGAAPVGVPADTLPPPMPDAVGDNTLTELPIWDSMAAENQQ